MSTPKYHTQYDPCSQVELDLLEEFSQLPFVVVDFVKLVNLDYMISVAMKYYYVERNAVTAELAKDR